MLVVPSKTIGKLEKKLLHYMGKAIADYKMIEHGDKILVCVSGGKDSFAMLWLLRLLQFRAKHKFEIFSYTLDQSQPGWDDSQLKEFLARHNITYEIVQRDTYSIVIDKIKNGKTFCSLCSRLRRGHIYSYAKQHEFKKIALGHHRDDAIQTLLLSIMYSGEIKSMPPKLLTDDKQHVVIRPLIYAQEADLREYAELKAFPLIPCNLCGSQENLQRKKIANLIRTLSLDNPKIPSNMLHALTKVSPSQLMDRSLWDFNF